MNCGLILFLCLKFYYQMKIGVLSDTHAFLHPRVFEFFAPCDEIWHCGDIGSVEVINQLKAFKPVRAVYGNIDGLDIRIQYSEVELFTTENTKICMTHIGGYPPHYNSNALKIIEEIKPAIFLCGHSHILRVMYDDIHHLLYINPGAAGIEGFHKKITFLRFDLNNAHPSSMEVFETDRILMK